MRGHAKNLVVRPAEGPNSSAPSIKFTLFTSSGSYVLHGSGAWMRALWERKCQYSRGYEGYWQPLLHMVFMVLHDSIHSANSSVLTFMTSIPSLER